MTDKYIAEEVGWDALRLALVRASAASRSVADARTHLAEFIDLVSDEVRRQRVSDLLTGIAVATEEVNDLLTAELRDLAASNGAPTELRDAVRETRGAITRLRRAWDEVDGILIREIVEYELSRPQQGNEWQDNWRGDARLAKKAADEVLSIGDEEDRFVLRLKYDRGLTQQQVADLTGLAQSTVAVRLARMEEQIALRVACDKLRDELTKEGFEILDSPELPNVDILARKNDARVIFEVKVSSDESSPRGRGVLHHRVLAKLEHLQSLVRGPLAEIGYSHAIVAVYFRRESVLGYLRLEEYSRMLRAGIPVTVQSISKTGWSLSESVR